MPLTATPRGALIIDTTLAREMASTGYVSSVNGEQGAVDLTGDYVPLKANGVTIGDSSIDVSGNIVIDYSLTKFWRRANNTLYQADTAETPGTDVQVVLGFDQAGAVYAIVPGSSSVSVLDRVRTLEAGVPASPVLSRVVGAWPASTAVPANTLYRLPTGGNGYLATARTTRAAFDATERAFWTFLPGGHHERLTSNASWVCPIGITNAIVGLTGSGGSGGGGGSASSSITQVGGSAGGAGVNNRFYIDGHVAGTGYAFVLGAAVTGGNGGAASGNAGSAGAAGGITTYVGPGGTTYSANGGGGGLGGAANSTTAVSAGTYGLASSIATAFIPGCGGTASSAAGNAAASGPATCGGGGGGPSSTTLGGLGGNARTAPGLSVAQQTGHGGTTAGGDGTAATEYGCGGGGGGGGANGGAGGNGAASAAGCIDFWY